MKPANSEDAEDAKRREREAKAKKSPASGLAFFNRSRSMGSSGLQAASIGWVLAGCVFFGYFAGTWLDGHFKTQFWMPVLVLLGVAAGFREMFVTLKQLQDAQQAEKVRAQHEKAQKPASPKLRLNEDTHSNQDFVQNTVNNAVDANVKIEAPKRLFHVPAPPTASFETRQTTDAEIARQEQLNQEQLNTEDILRALQDEPEQDEPEDERTARSDNAP